MDYRHFERFNLIGESPPFLKLLENISKVSKLDAPVLITGETGTGKELVARSIHSLGFRKNKPFIPVNCGALPETLIESEFFGHKPGSFTDAKSEKLGLLDQSNGGILFLDELSNLSKRAQATLLRFFQDFTFRPLGGITEKKVDVRVIAATNRPLVPMIQEGGFREDLFFRLNIISLSVPPLRDRGEDIELLSDYLLSKYAELYKIPAKQIPQMMLSRLREHSWPGNVRELENFIYRFLVLSEGDDLAPFEDLVSLQLNKTETFKNSEMPFESLNYKEEKKKALQAFEKNFLRHLFKKSNGSLKRASEISGKDRSALGKLVKKNGIKRDI